MHSFLTPSLTLKLRLRAGTCPSFLGCWCQTSVPGPQIPSHAASCKCQVARGLQPLLPDSFDPGSTKLLPGRGNGLGHDEFISNNVSKCVLDERKSPVWVGLRLGSLTEGRYMPCAGGVVGKETLGLRASWREELCRNIWRMGARREWEQLCWQRNQHVQRLADSGGRGRLGNC